MMPPSKKPTLRRSEAFRAAVEADRTDLTPTERVLLDEACRLMDRIDRFDALLSADAVAWATVRDFDGDRPTELVVSSLISESRQHASELRQLVRALGASETRAAAPTVSELERLRSRKGA